MTKKILASIALASAGVFGNAENLPAAESAVPEKTEPFAQRASAAAEEFSAETIPAKTITDLLWAANGVNRDNGKRTAPTALNQQEIGVFVIRADGAFAAEIGENEVRLVPRSSKDLRAAVVGGQTQFGHAPVMILLTADISKFSMMPEDRAIVAASVDTGAVMQNILLFCAQANLAARPRMSMDAETLSKELSLPEKTLPLINVVVGKKL